MIKYNQTTVTYGNRINGETSLLNDPSPEVELSNLIFFLDRDYLNTTFIDISNLIGLIFFYMSHPTDHDN